VSLATDGVTTEAGRAVLADDAAILARLPAERLGPLVLERTSAMLTEPVQRLAAPLLIHVARGVTLRQSRGGGIFAMAPGRAEGAAARVGACLVGHGPVRRLGQSVFDAVAASDGAPLVGPVKDLNAIVLAGFGLSGAFFAPGLARLLAGAAAPRELSYFSAREAGRGKARALIADYARGLVISEATA
jgi:glycine/D-amino acid oxidase-like deaminating enzyme